MAQAAPLWGALPIDDKAKYLGMWLGPGRGAHSWTSPFRKFQARARYWGGAGAGMFQTLLAYQVYVASVLLFVAQLLPLPPSFAAEEERACAALFRGPAGWVTVEALKDLTSLHFPRDFPDLPSAAARLAGNPPSGG